MRHLSVILFTLFLALSACQQLDETGLDSLENNANEIYYNPTVYEELKSDEISFFGIMLGDNVSKLIELHGEPDVKNSYRFGLINNYEYFFDTPETVVLYHEEEGIIESVLLPKHANTLLNNSLPPQVADVYNSFGQPTLIQETETSRIYYFDELGVEAFQKDGGIDRLYFTTPNRNLTPAGVDVIPDCELPPTSAVNEDGECFDLPNGCFNESIWTPVDSCTNTTTNVAPTICIQVITPAINPEDGSCVEFSTPCDVPSTWERVSQC